MKNLKIETGLAIAVVSIDIDEIEKHYLIIFIKILTL